MGRFINLLYSESSDQQYLVRTISVLIAKEFGRDVCVKNFVKFSDIISERMPPQSFGLHY